MPVPDAQRSCYCFLWEQNAESLRQQGIPPGYCGMCQVCGAAGHTRHYPGPVPYTGAWCDACYAQLADRATLGRFIHWVLLLIAFASGMLVLLRLVFT